MFAEPYADPKHAYMSGLSHGGCITTRAVQRGAPVQLAIDMFGPADWAIDYEGWVAGIAAGLAVSLERILSLNPNDNQGVRFCLDDVRRGRSWEESEG